jgi:hypothetical protein
MTKVDKKDQIQEAVVPRTVKNVARYQKQPVLATAGKQLVNREVDSKEKPKCWRCIVHESKYKGDSEL